MAGLSAVKKNVGFIGIEVFQNGVAHLLTLMTGVRDAEHITDEISILPERADNVRIYDDDAIIFDDPDHSIEEERFMILGIIERPKGHLTHAIGIVCHCYREERL